PGPQRQHLLDLGPRQGLHRRELFQEAFVEREHRLHPGLLEHHLGEPDLVRIARPAPGEVAAVPIEPREEIVGAPHCVILIARLRPIWQSYMMMRQDRDSAPGRKPALPPRREGAVGGRPHLSGWLLWLYPCS